MSSNINKAVNADDQHQNAVSGQQQWMSLDRTGYFTTAQLAAVLSLHPQSLRKRFSQTGTYFGLKPVKLPNRRLAWKADAVAKFLRGEGA